ncbi:MAG TPA: hypothetical protein VHV57_11170 [Acidimicrobiales bacterium]|jgi:septal ring factor EnvC (AmiA/AmiB activator)|nr:hypothetical protein [Acidimicrobiales bacterium]
MVIDLLVAPPFSQHVDQKLPSRPPARRRRRWILAVALIVLAGLAVVLSLALNERQVNTRFDASHRQLTSTHVRLRNERHTEALLQKSVNDLLARSSHTSTSLSQTTAQLSQVDASLTHEQAAVAQQGSSILGLQACLGGVEQALNALSVGDQRSALAALHAVSASCQSAVASSG